MYSPKEKEKSLNIHKEETFTGVSFSDATISCYSQFYVGFN